MTAAETGTHAAARDLAPYRDAETAFAAVERIYAAATAAVRDRFDAFGSGDRDGASPAAFYPYVGIDVPAAAMPEGLIAKLRFRDAMNPLQNLLIRRHLQSQLRHLWQIFQHRSGLCSSLIRRCPRRQRQAMRAPRL